MTVFISYSHNDERFRVELIKHLSMLRNDRVIEVWHDRNISGGQEWAGQIDDNLEEASIILLLISADFLASTYCYDKEMARALENTKREKLESSQLSFVQWTGAQLLLPTFKPFQKMAWQSIVGRKRMRPGLR